MNRSRMIRQISMNLNLYVGGSNCLYTNHVQQRVGISTSASIALLIMT